MAYNWLLFTTILLKESAAQGAETTTITRSLVDTSSEEAGLHSCDGEEIEWDFCHNSHPCHSCKAVDCKFSTWSDWSFSGNCDGLRFRNRTVESDSNECGAPCNGPKMQTEAFQRPECETKATGSCKFASWSAWSECASGTSQTFRHRSAMVTNESGSATCLGPTKETAPCGSSDTKPCHFTAWQSWTSCSSSCGGGRQTRMRRLCNECGGENCRGTLLETQPCSTQLCDKRDCNVSQWSGWSFCDGNHLQSYRHRSILHPAAGLGIPCNDSLMETKSCTTNGTDPCELTDWTDWEACDVQCGTGQTGRTRTLKSTGTKMKACPGMVLREVKACVTKECPMSASDCLLSDWAAWSGCSADCGLGSKTRLRSIARHARQGGQGCSGATQEMDLCSGQHCGASDCKWSVWDDWSACSCSCGGGSKRRSRAVQSPPANGGGLCSPLVKSEITSCNTQSCAGLCTDGLWGDWSFWTQCSSKCGSGFQFRRRDMAQPPSSCGKPPDGYREEYKLCANLPPCATNTDCQLTDWGDWSPCSCTCSGIRERNRRIGVFASGNGTECVDEPLKQIEPCNPRLHEASPTGCGELPKQDCVLDQWSDWTSCSKPCNGGQQSRTRDMIKLPTGGGKPCDGNLSVTVGCNTLPCSKKKEVCIDCRWSAWSKWGSCSKCGGQRYRSRFIEQLANHCGTKCDVAFSKETSNCTSSCSKTLYCAWTSWTDDGVCTGGCQDSTLLRTRALGLIKKSTNYLFMGAHPLTCTGVQINVSLCPGAAACESTCVQRNCAFGDWSEWREPTCLGLCERERIIVQTNNECGKPCSGSIHETKRCAASCADRLDCILSEWAEWSACTKRDRSEQKHRTREITQMPKSGGKPCTGILSEVASCAGNAQPCVFSSWAEWGVCEVECGRGYQRRARKVAAPSRHGGDPCVGNSLELRPCFVGCATKAPSHQACALADWNDWSGCGNDGQRHRNRGFATYAEPGGKGCDGSLRQTETCGMEVVDCRVSEWTDWDACSATCGGAQTNRQRQIHRFPMNGGTKCPPELWQTKGCNLAPAPGGKDCAASKWSDWGACTVTCGSGGQQTRNRTVVQERRVGGTGCNMELGQVRACLSSAGKAPLPCTVAQDCKWSDWTHWSECSASCNGGQMNRTRDILVHPNAKGRLCDAREKEDTRPCNVHDCTGKNKQCEQGEWSEWEPWSPCSATCAGGQMVRHRQIRTVAHECKTPAPGKDREYKFCNVGVECRKAVDCKMATWSTWSNCSAQCDGVQSRSRDIARFGHGAGQFCHGPLLQSQSCNSSAGANCKSTPVVDCILEEWSRWSPCPVTCGGGQQNRSRSARQLGRGGTSCAGTLAEVRECARQNCSTTEPVNCKLGDWQDWLTCIKSSGQKKRIREILQQPAHGGKPCNIFVAEEIGNCLQKVKSGQFCAWASWRTWSTCSSTCGTGRRSRKRSLQLSSAPAEPPAELMAKFDALYTRMRVEEVSHSRSLLLAFLGGCVSLGITLISLRACDAGCRHRRGRSSGEQLARSFAGRIGRQELLEDRCPLVEDSACADPNVGSQTA